MSTMLLRDCIRTSWNLGKSGMVAFSRRAVVYRKVQIIGKLQTEVQAGALMGILIFAPISVISITFVMLVELTWNAENLTLLTLSAYLDLVCTLYILFVLGSHAGVWSDSREMFDKLDRLLLHRWKCGKLLVNSKEWKCETRF